MSSQPEDPHSRNIALARLVAEALRVRASSAGPANGCPDAEILAVYAEHGLSEEECARWERHFADCDRCQKVIAIVAADADDLTPAEVQALGSLAAATAVVRVPVAPAINIRPRRQFWPWLVPAMGLAAAVALWFAIHPSAPSPVLTAQRDSQTQTPANEAAPSIPPPARPEPLPAAKETAPSPAAPAPPAQRQSVPAAGAATASPAVPSSGALDALREPPQAGSPVAPSPDSAPRQEAYNSAAAVENRAVTESATNGRFASRADDAGREPAAQAAPVGGAAGAGAATGAPPPGLQGLRSAPQTAGNVVGAARPQALALTKTAAPPFVFGSRTSLWRPGPAGRIEHSNDGGRTWQPQASGVTSDLLAGAASSEQAAWIVGRAGTILRTADSGQNWQVVTPPPGPAQDWTAVQSRDALRATVTGADGRRFATEDGGRTWVQQQ